MNVLIVAATRLELNSLLNLMGLNSLSDEPLFDISYNKLKITFGISGVGMVATSFFMGKLLALHSYDLALNIGVCGAFDKSMTIGSVVCVTEDIFSELGAEDGEQFISLKELGFGENKIVQSSKFKVQSSGLNTLLNVRGITVNTVHGNERSIQKIVDLYQPDVESMEGAAFMYACEQTQIPYAQIRAVSNYVEKRNKENWNMPLALENLSQSTKQIIDAIIE